MIWLLPFFSGEKRYLQSIFLLKLVKPLSAIRTCLVVHALQSVLFSHTLAAHSGVHHGICRWSSSAGDSGEGGTSREQRSTPGRTRLWLLLYAVERNRPSEVVLCFLIKHVPSVCVRVWVATCLRCSLSAILRLPLWCRSISQVIKP